MQLSIVVPIYNVEKYLPKCVDSLLNQGLASTDYEIILVDDGSTDRSGTIADDYAKRYAHIRVIHQTNQGLSMARNAGMALAQGDYVQFVDSDDYLEPNVLGALVNKMDYEHLDILRFNYQNVDECYRVFEPYKDPKTFVDYTDSVVNGLTFLTERLGYGCYAWQFVMRTSLVAQSPFTAGIYFEDTEWVPRLLTSAERVTSVNVVVYNYLMRQGSITQSVSEEKKRKVLTDKISLVHALQQQMADKTDKRWYEGMIAHTVLSIFGCIVADFYVERATYLRLLRQSHVYPLSYYHATRRVKRKLWLINLSPALFCWSIYVKGKINL